MYQLSLPEDLFIELNKGIEIYIENLRGFKQSNYTFEQYERIFSDFGWYILYELKMKDVPIIVNQFENNEIDKADKILIKHFKIRLKHIENQLIQSFPERKNILTEAFYAHRKKMFFSSTILFLSQADGITENKIFMGFNFKKFSKNNEKHPLVLLFKNKNPLTDHFNKGDQNSMNSDCINRHGIMHGLQQNYGSELNSLKALSFLWFVSNFRNKIE
jgi:hypothetical protein